MNRLATLLCISSLVGVSTYARATVLRVPSQYPTIQEGIDAALEGDTVLVADGTYTDDGNRDIDFGGKGIVVRSENGPEVTIIDCEGDSLDPHIGFYFHSGEDSASVVRGFTIRNGYAFLGWPGDNGGGIFCDSSSSPTISTNTITANSATWGGGIACSWHSSPTIVGNMIAGNAAGGGGGICCSWGSSPSILGNTITGNMATSVGGTGGGIFCGLSNPTIKRNEIIQNTAGALGGGIASLGCDSLTIADNVIRGNTADHTGGGIHCYSSYMIIEGNTITENTASYGGGICCHHSSPTITSNTISGNTADDGGGGILSSYSSSPTVTNSILWEDSASVAQEIYLEYSSSITVTYSDVEGGSSAVYVTPSCTLYWGEGDIDADPMFVLRSKRDYRLLWDSACIDTGHPDSLDPDGTRSDIGAHFFDQEDYMTLYLTSDTTEVSPGGVLGVTYTVINRWAQPEPFWVVSEAILPNGNPLNVFGPDQYTLPAETTVQQHLTHDVPLIAPLGVYEYRSTIGVPPSTLYDEDSFEFKVVEP